VRRSGATALACFAALSGSGCFGSGADEPAPDRVRQPAADRRPAPADGPPPTARLKRSRCPADMSTCRTASGRIVYVERVDPDGDGDAHFVLTSRQSITLPSVSVIDVKRSLRPHPLPGVGDRISAAGPVYRGSYGQKQIEAIELHVARAR
jgi:hypothetical protein